MAFGLSLGVHSILHAVLAVLLVIELGLTSYVVSVTRAPWWASSPSQFNFMLFNSVWSLLVLAYVAITPRFAERAYHGMVAAGLLAVTTIFWFAGSIAMAAFIGVPECRGPAGVCTALQSAQAAVAFGFFIWAIFAALTALDGMSLLRGGGARADTTRKPSQSGPASQPYPGA